MVVERFILVAPTNSLFSHVSFPFPWKSIWCTKAPQRVAFFVWLAALGKILTLDNLRRKNMFLINRCGMCKKDEESIDHLLLHCECVKFLWNAFFTHFDLAWAMPHGVVNLLQCWWSGGCSRSVVIWKMVSFCIMWCLWSEWNVRFFEDSEKAWRIFYISFLLLSSLGRQFDLPL
jgi:hypothetical protein